ncbi:uncharacterized protein PITG_17116 [Phytophthora infestans T30-4]|uniref:Uncharacterized protein n=1 Tax=Phytophthora infestans (strain T30-4) TaxID=403677 RepID=D0NV26_PHYIT|nr:uncharacterized protein PITG_17116 [Phytophthora infestans T30-4]EEY66498.1 conserved hypothetical protein [Phytophthora infestans T30-4]|eukprot:XP_002897017.1 conserved hypothetical protein [Phytophthora infestans T30-4]
MQSARRRLYARLKRNWNLTRHLGISAAGFERPSSVPAFADTFRAKFDRLDFAHPTHTPDGLEMQFAVNHLGHFYLTHLLFDLLKSGNEVSRIVNVSSLSHRWVKMNLRTLARSKTNKKLYAKEYGTSKLANMLFTFEL